MESYVRVTPSQTPSVIVYCISFVATIIFTLPVISDMYIVLSTTAISDMSEPFINT